MREEMTFRELLGIVCARWRMILVLGLAFALVMGVVRAYSDFRNLADAVAIEASREENLLEWRQYETKIKALEQEILQLERQEEQALLYNENSLLMQIDPYNVEVARLTFNVTADAAAIAKELPESWQAPTFADLKESREDRIVNQYLVVAEGASLSALMADTSYAKIADQYLREIVTVSEYAQGMVVIEVYSTTTADGMGLAEKVYAYCLSRQSEIAASAGAHTVKVVDAVSTTEIDLTLLDAQLLAQSRPADLSALLASKTKELEQLEEPAKFTAATTANVVSSGIKYAALGAVVGVCAGAVLAFLIETMGANFRNGTALSQAVSSRYLGNLNAPQKRSGLDLWAANLLGEDIFSTVSKEDRLPLLAANIKEAAKDKRRLLITGMRSQNELERLAEELRQHLGSEYQLAVAANLLTNAHAIQQLKDIEGVIMVEGTKTANIERVIRAKQYLDEAKSTLLGVVWA